VGSTLAAVKRCLFIPHKLLSLVVASCVKTTLFSLFFCLCRVLFLHKFFCCWCIQDILSVFCFHFVHNSPVFLTVSNVIEVVGSKLCTDADYTPDNVYSIINLFRVFIYLFIIQC